MTALASDFILVELNSKKHLLVVVMCVCQVILVTYDSATLWTVPTGLLCPWASPGKNTRVGCHALLQGILPTQGLNPHLLSWQAECLPLSHLERPFRQNSFPKSAQAPPIHFPHHLPSERSFLCFFFNALLPHAGHILIAWNHFVG